MVMECLWKKGGEEGKKIGREGGKEGSRQVFSECLRNSNLILCTRM